MLQRPPSPDCSATTDRSTLFAGAQTKCDQLDRVLVPPSRLDISYNSFFDNLHHRIWLGERRNSQLIQWTSSQPNHSSVKSLERSERPSLWHFANKGQSWRPMCNTHDRQSSCQIHHQKGLRWIRLLMKEYQNSFQRLCDFDIRLPNGCANFQAAAKRGKQRD